MISYLEQKYQKLSKLDTGVDFKHAPKYKYTLMKKFPKKNNKSIACPFW